MCKRCLFVTMASGLILLVWNARAEAPDGRVQSTYDIELVGALNPEGLLLTAGVYRRWTLSGEVGEPTSPYLQSGFKAGLSPGYTSGKVYAEWMPHAAFQLRTQYALFRYFGAYSSLLSFPSGDSAFGKDEVDSLESEEEAAWGQRFLLRPILRAKIGPLLLRNVTDFAYCRFSGRGPYFLDWEYYTLAKDGDWMISDTLQALFKLHGGPGAEALYAGPFFEVTHAEAAGITQQRAGIAADWTVRDRLGSLSRPRSFLQLGTHLRDPNREGELYALFGVGFDIN